LATLAAPGVSATARSRVDVTDHDLVEAVRAGDDLAFERLYDRYRRRIAAYIHGMVRDHGRAEDLTQEVFVSALRRMRQTDRPIAFKPWIYEIAKNACIDAFRRSRRAEEVSYDAEDGLGAGDYVKLVSTTAAPDVAVDHKQQLDHLRGAFGGLSEAHHQILVMREFEGLSYREIGERLGMSRPSVESTLFRARRRLTEEYGELVSGERCLRIQGIIAQAVDGPLGVRDQRRVGSHISYCQPCRKQARLAGLDAAAMAHRPVRAKIAALLPLPAFLRRRWLPEPDDSGTAMAAAPHAHSLAQVSMAAAQYGEPTMSGWMKATAVATAVAVTGLGAGTAAQHAGGHRRHHTPAIQRSAAAPRATKARPPVAPATIGASSGTVRHSRVASGTGATAQSNPATAPAHPESAAGVAPRGAGGSTGRHATGDATSAAGGAGGGATSTATGPATQVTKPVTTVVNTLTDGGGGATGGGGGSSQPIVNPDPSQAVPAASGASSPPSSLGGAVTQVTGSVGGTVGGSAGQAITDTGQTAGTAVDQTTQTVTGAVGGILGGK
jgi:RNA polymerase sigma factor (sigma-70 family)